MIAQWMKKENKKNADSIFKTHVLGKLSTNLFFREHIFSSSKL